MVHGGNRDWRDGGVTLRPGHWGTYPQTALAKSAKGPGCAGRIRKRFAGPGTRNVRARAQTGGRSGGHVRTRPQNRGKHRIQFEGVSIQPAATQGTISMSSTIAEPVKAAKAFSNEPVADFSKPANREAMERALREVKAQLGREYDLLIASRKEKTGDLLKSLNPSN